MPGERILIVDQSVAVQDLARAVLESHGYRVTTAGNGLAAIAAPEAAQLDLVVLDATLDDVTTKETIQGYRCDKELYQKPVLLLIPDEKLLPNTAPDLFGANTWMRKPFNPDMLVQKVAALLEEKEVLDRSREFLREAADGLMKRLADAHIQAAVEQRTQIIIERALQLVVTQVDQKARREVDQRITALTADKEQELVKTTVNEVARAMVEKLAERKVTEAMENILHVETEKTVRNVAENLLPPLVRDRLREHLEQMLPKEVQRRVQKEAENLVPEISGQVIQIIDAAAQTQVPKIARELMGDMARDALDAYTTTALPRHVHSMVSQEIESQIRTRMAPIIREATSSIRKQTMGLLIVFIVISLIGFGLIITDRVLSGTPFLGIKLGSGPSAADATEVAPVTTSTPAPRSGTARNSAGNPASGISGLFQKLPNVIPTPIATPRP